ncbi:MAG TPA: hypothetical protein DDZ83_13755 [Nitrospinae bacterium]|nr:hypothetical protein [Nitrospinota bacterium]
MLWVIVLLGILICALGGAGMVSPGRMVRFVAHMKSRTGLYAASILRLGMGAVMLIAAAGSRAPLYLRILGWVTIAAGLGLPLLGQRRYEALLAWWIERPESYQRSQAAVAVLFGASLIWAAFT